MTLSAGESASSAARSRGGRSSSATGVPGATSTPSSRLASRLHTDTRPAASTASTPSPIPCRTASRSCTSSASSCGSRPRVSRLSRRASSTEPATPSSSAAPAKSATRPSRCTTSPRISSVAKPTLTSPTTAPVPSRSGTFARADRPSVPRSTITTSRPDSAADGSVLTGWPSRSGLGCDRRSPVPSVTTTNSAPVRARTASARACTTCSGSCRAAAFPITGSAATVRATASARCSYCLVSSVSSSHPISVNPTPTTSVTTPICSASICRAKRTRGALMTGPYSACETFRTSSTRLGATSSTRLRNTPEVIYGPAMTVDPVIALRGATKRFRTASGGVHTAVHDLTFDVAAGEFVAVVGPTGCGKSTTLALVSGLEPPSAGTVLVRGEPVRGIPAGVGYMFQTDAVMPWRSVLDNVAAGPRFRGACRAQARDHARGWVLRVALAQTLVNEPEIMLMDEPFSALDVQTRGLMQDELLRLWAGTGAAVVFVTHDLEEAIALADRVVVMTASPATVKASFPVPLERPRDVEEIRLTTAFLETYREVWESLREEVARSRTQSREEAVRDAA